VLRLPALPSWLAGLGPVASLARSDGALGARRPADRLASGRWPAVHDYPGISRR